MNRLLTIIAIPFSLAGSLAVILEVYSRTAEAQRATSQLVTSLAQLSLTIPRLILFIGLLSLMIAVAYAIISFANSGSKRVNVQTQLITQSHLRLAGRGSIVATRLLNSGYKVLEGENNEKVFRSHV